MKHATCQHRKYGLTCQQYDQLRRRARNRCEICRTHELATAHRRLVIDHLAGSSPRVRGLLCDWCNSCLMAWVDGHRPWSPGFRRLERRARRYANA